jgi:putative ABC transport system ATP-binding protein
MAAPLIDIRDAWKIYSVGDVDVPAVRDVSLAIPYGQFVAITGASGSGKSTFMHLIGCLDQLTRGTFHFEGQQVSNMSRHELAVLRNERIGFVFQNFNLLSRTTVLDNVALPLAYQRVPRRERRERAAEMLTRLGLQDRLRHHPNQLSGGQQQRVAIARALVTRPVVILADEPTGNLDSQTGEDIMKLFTDLNRREGITIVLVTHEPDIAAHARRHVIFRDGRVVSDTQQDMVSAA